jgi:hypothetical protein
MARIRDLEHALATLQATYHTTPHPLLRKELRDIANAPAPPPPPPPADVSEANDADPTATNEVDHLSENLGTLSMTGYGRSRFFGLTGSSWVGSLFIFLSTLTLASATTLDCQCYVGQFSSLD